MKMTTADATPWIGMPAEMDPEGNELYVDRRYSDAIAEAGGIPIIIPLLLKAKFIQPIAERLDGILLTGSHSDVDPFLYNARRSDACGSVQPLRDQMDFFMLETSIRRKIPVFAICFGIQSLNVFLGGSLIQDIPAFMNTPIRHNQSESKGFPCHKIEISSGSILERIAGGMGAMVNSTHHQAIDRLGQGLKLDALAPDGIIESVSSADPSHWILGVQWHPERSFACDDFSRKLFEDFLARCRAVRGMNEGTHT
jgi:putative glutamine amidotransferase